jgi:branched-chain amino acid transport system permease protein
MSLGLQFYISTLLVFWGINTMACWALNLQIGVAGVLNLAVILFQSAGAYTAAVLSLGPQSNLGGFQQYIGGFTLPFPLPIVAAGVVGGLLSAPIGVVVLRRLRRDYQAVTLLVIGIIAWSVVITDRPLFNGAAGLSLIPHPLNDQLGLELVDYQWFYVGLTAAVCLITYAVVRLVTRSPLGRTLRAVRDDELAAAALGKDVFRLRLLVLVVGGVIAGISGAMFVGFIGIWSPGAWGYQEVLVVVAAMIIGGQGNNWGAVLGALIVPVGIGEATRFLPAFGPIGFIDAMQWVVIGVAMIAFIYFWPRGLLPERPRRYKPPEAADEAVGAGAR